MDHGARMLLLMPQLVLLAPDSPLVYRSAVVAAGVLCPAAQGQPTVVAAVMELLSGCLHRPAATMRAWGRGEDHVAAVTFWRLAVSCPTELAPSFHQLAADLLSAPETKAAMTSNGWGGRRTDGRRLLVRGLGAVLSGSRTTGAWSYNRPCAQQYVVKSQSCMFTSGRLIRHAPVLTGVVQQ